jgi:hypothetical protein
VIIDPGQSNTQKMKSSKCDSSESGPNGTYLKIFATEAHRITRKKNALLIEYFRVIPWLNRVFK